MSLMKPKEKLKMSFMKTGGKSFQFHESEEKIIAVSWIRGKYNLSLMKKSVLYLFLLFFVFFSKFYISIIYLFFALPPPLLLTALINPNNKRKRKNMQKFEKKYFVYMLGTLDRWGPSPAVNCFFFNFHPTRISTQVCPCTYSGGQNQRDILSYQNTYPSMYMYVSW